MWVEELPSGRYRAAERYTDPLTGKVKKISITMDKNTTASRKSAEKILLDKINDKLVVSRDSTRNITLSQLISLWLEYQERTVKQSTYKRNFHSSNRLIEILGGDVFVSKLSAGYVMQQLMKHDKKPGTINEHLVRFKSILRWGYKYDYVDDISWLAKLEPQKDDEKKEKLSDKYMESYELKLVLDSIDIIRWKHLVHFLALTGMRVGEAFALRPEDIDMVSRQIHVIRTFDVVNNIFTSPKTDTSVRDVYITDELYPLCKSLRSDALEAKLSGGTGMIFYQKKHDYYAFNKYFKNITKSVLGRELTVHALRHTHVSLLAEHGVPLEVISRRLGHNSSSITKEVYFHVTQRLKEKEDEQLKKISLL
ncbi:MAG: site-specific integrase [Bacteroidales bacterium]|nr:site-specific integrase [Candidatus Scybalousia scybalohippi]